MAESKNNIDLHPAVAQRLFQIGTALRYDMGKVKGATAALEAVYQATEAERLDPSEVAEAMSFILPGLQKYTLRLDAEIERLDEGVK